MGVSPNSSFYVFSTSGDQEISNTVTRVWSPGPRPHGAPHLAGETDGEGWDRAWGLQGEAG